MSLERTLEALKKRENNLMREMRAKFKDFDMAYSPFHDTELREMYRQGIKDAIEYYKNGKFTTNRTNGES